MVSPQEKIYYFQKYFCQYLDSGVCGWLFLKDLCYTLVDLKYKYKYKDLNGLKMRRSVVVCRIKGCGGCPGGGLLSHFASAVKTPFQLAPQLHNCTPSSHHPREHLRPTERQRRHEMGSSWIVNPFGGRCIVESCLAKVTFHGYKFSRIIVFQRCELHIVKPLKAKLSII